MNKLLCLLLLFTITSVNAQNKASLLYQSTEKRHQEVPFISTQLFIPEHKKMPGTDTISNINHLSIDKNIVLSVIRNKPAGIILDIPETDEKTYTLILAEQEITTTSALTFNSINDSVRKPLSSYAGIHYRGYISGDSSSIACFSFFKNGTVMGLYANKKGNFTVGKMNNTEQGYVVYNSRNMADQPRYLCAINDLMKLPSKNSNSFSLPLPQSAPPPVLCNKLKLYWECDYQLYSEDFENDLTETINYMTGLFNIVSSVFENEGITIEFSDLGIWTSPDPYRKNNSSNALTDFKSYWNTRSNRFNGDFAHLIAGGTSNNGGIAFLLENDICYRNFAFGYSNVYAAYNDLPSYSWDVSVLSHELGHNFGLHHTQWCGWQTGKNGTCGAIDNCYTLEETDTCNTCSSTVNIDSLPC